jgi:large subunit ribosomal protein L4
VQATVYNLAGEELEKIELDDTIFGITPNMAVVHQAVLRQQANARQGTHDTKTRAEVRGGGRKPWRQKGTGRARQGSTRAPQWRHGGVVFGPHPRSYEQDMPRKMRRLAIRSVLSGKARDGEIVIVDSFEELEPRTKAMVEVLSKLNIGENTALIMTSARDENLEKAASNLPKVKTMSAHLLSVVDMLKHSYIVMPRASLDIVNSILGNGGGRTKLSLRGSTVANGANGKAATETKASAATEKPAKSKAQTKTRAEVEVEVETESPAPAKSRTKTTRAAAAPTAPAAEAAIEADEAETAAEGADETIVFAPSSVIQDTAAATIDDTAEESDAAKAEEGEI